MMAKKTPKILLWVCALTLLSAFSRLSEAYYTYDGPTAGCPTGWLYMHHACYLRKTTAASWSEAEDDCVSLGAHLPSILSMTEQARFNTLIEWESSWLGVYQSGPGGTWINMDGIPLDFTFYSYRNHFEPDGSGPCLYIWRDIDGWRDTSCTHLRKYFCKLYARDIGCAPPERYTHAVTRRGPALVHEVWNMACKSGWRTASNESTFNIVCTQATYYIDDPGHWTSSVAGCLEDRDECEDAEICGSFGICVNTVGSYLCLCEYGYEWPYGAALPEPDDLTAPHGQCQVPGSSRSCLTPSIPNGVFEYSSMTFGSVAQLNCSSGYRPLQLATDVERVFHYDNFTLVCDDPTAQWILQTPLDCSSLTEVWCGDPGLKPFATRSGDNYYYPGEVRYTCIQGYTPSNDIDGDIVISCQENGLWSPSVHCVDIDECLSLCTTSKCINYPGTYTCNYSWIFRRLDIYLLSALFAVTLLQIFTVVFIRRRIGYTAPK